LVRVLDVSGAVPSKKRLQAPIEGWTGEVRGAVERYAESLLKSDPGVAWLWEDLRLIAPFLPEGLRAKVLAAAPSIVPKAEDLASFRQAEAWRPSLPREDLSLSNELRAPAPVKFRVDFRIAREWMDHMGGIEDADALGMLGLDLKAVWNKQAFCKTMGRLNVSPEDYLAKPPAERRPFLFHAFVDHVIAVLKRVVEAGEGLKLGPEETWDLAAALDDIMTLKGCLPQEVQGSLGRAARVLGGVNPVSPAVPAAAGPPKPMGFEEILSKLAKEGSAFHLFKDLAGQAWTQERKERLKGLFLETGDSELRRDLARFLTGDAFPSSGIAETVGWLFPGLLCELARLHPKPSQETLAKDLLEFFIENPRALLAWARSIPPPSPKAAGPVLDEGYLLPYPLRDSSEPAPPAASPLPASDPGAFVFLGGGPLEEARTPEMLLALGALRKGRGSGQDTLFFDEARLWQKAVLPDGSADLFAGLSSGGLRVRYRDNGASPGVQERLGMISSFLMLFGMRVQRIGERGLTASWNSSPRRAAEAFPFILGFLRGSGGMDGLWKAARSSPETLDAAREAALAYFGEGTWPFDADWKDFKAYKAREPGRRGLAERINRELARLDLPPMPAGLPFGRRTIEMHFSGVLEEAAARGDIVFPAGGAPGRAFYPPVDELARSALFEPVESMLSASAAAGLRFEPFGRVGGFLAEAAQVRLSDGSLLAVSALREPRSGSVAFARASRWTRGGGLEPLGAGGLESLLARQGYPAAKGPAPGREQSVRLREILFEKADAADAGAGEGVSPGRGEFTTGRLLFDGTKPQEGGVLALPKAGPGDMEAIARAGAVVATGSGLLGHAAITARELEIPMVVLRFARWFGSGSGKFLVLESRGAVDVRLGPGGVEVSRLGRVEPVYLFEGDVVRVHGKTGELEVVSRAGPSPIGEAFDALEGVLSGRSAGLEWRSHWGADVERFLLEEAFSNPRCSSRREALLGEIKKHSRSLGALDFHPPLPRRGRDRFGPPDDRDFPGGPKPLWERLLKRIEASKDKSGLLRLARRMLRRGPGLGKSDLGVIFVCTGNTCRSPMAEQIARSVFDEEGLGGFRVGSRGIVSGFGGDMSVESRLAMRSLGFAPRPHTARGLDEEAVRAADLILVMEKFHVWDVLRMFPWAASKVMLFNRFAGLGDKSIQDPIGRAGLGYGRGPEAGGFFWEREDALRRNLSPFPGPLGAGADFQGPGGGAFSNGYDDAAQEILNAARGTARQLKAYLRLISLVRDSGREKIESLPSRPAALPLASLDDDWEELAGAKSASLGEMRRALGGLGVRLPEGFAVTSWAFDRFVEENGLRERLAALNAELGEAREAGEIKRVSREIREAILSGRLESSRGAGKEVMEALKALDGPLAVRSSVIPEGSPAAFAGAAQTFLFVRPEELLGRLVECWASFWLDRGLLYRRGRGLPLPDIRPAALVQEMVPADASGVIFTRDPVGAGEDVVIEAAYGLGDGVAGGLCEADVYSASPRDGVETRVARVADKLWMSVPAKGTGTRFERVPPDRRGRRVLGPGEVRRLALAAKALSRRTGAPMNVEFSIRAGEIYFLQARPVTTR
jgi:protein-tyrosine-phosphatase/phosphohistidine swiveling domain-containing protein